jgi:hypothetical protein
VFLAVDIFGYVCWKAFTGGEGRAQITAAEEIGTNGWMLWNPHNRYSRADVRVDDRPVSPVHP